ncbi:hypothetical protein NDU88_008762 [Pleurodeles waltl]|uniref:Uncharacterized protein n=1 Tax=Pleurodeles waltl TaxID=8319 RepID=A0AAV7RWF3_PLEWA|nr:hypothetical protein NDU88_008762 [Pleurodeles waltl]
MQTQIRRVAKTCSEFTARMEEAETHISRLEDDVGSQKMTWEAMEKQHEDTQWKLTDLEDRLRRNNRPVLDMSEGAEGSDPHGFMVALFKEAFPDLHQWDWDSEIQRAHRFPFNRAGLSSTEGSGRPRAMLISLRNFQARQAVYDRAQPNTRCKAKGCIPEASPIVNRPRYGTVQAGSRRNKVVRLRSAAKGRCKSWGAACSFLLLRK